MQSFFLLADALAYIEAHLGEPLPQEGIAAGCYCSVSTLQKLFRYSMGMGVKDYVNRRRLTQAAALLQDSERKITDIALAYQYQSPEVFTRAFRRLWGVTPSEYRKTWRFSRLFPKVEGLMQGGDGTMRRRLDISELYETLKRMTGTYVLCFDIRNLMAINEIARDAGDRVIVECLRRLDEAADDTMLLFRIGGDEFALVTGYAAREQVEAVAAKVLDQNGNPIVYEGREIPVAMRAGAIRIKKGNLRYTELYDTLNNSVLRAIPDNTVHFAMDA